jgi:hypothetical protein
MRIPTRGRAGWARDLVQQCTSSRNARINRGAAFRNLFYTGDWEGKPQHYLRTQDLIRDLQAFLYSSADLRFALDFYGPVSPVTRAKGNTMASVLYEYTRNGHVDTLVSQAVLSSLIKGKALFQVTWSNNGIEPYVIQPELFGVGREDIPYLDRQDFFCHTSFLSPARFRDMVNNTTRMEASRKKEIIRAAERHSRRVSDGEGMPTSAVLKQIMVGGISPYTTVDSPQSRAGGQVLNWLFAPQAVMRPDVVDQLVPYDTLWVKNSEDDDWATITMVGDEIVYGEVNYNAFAEDFRRKGEVNGDTWPDMQNPLRGKHPYIQFCPFPMEDYFWGWSSVQLVARLQNSLNARITGINMLLRMQEDPPRYMRGSQTVNQTAYNRLNRPGGYTNDPNPNAKIEELAREIPKDMWLSFHELDAMFDRVAGFPAVTRGEGEPGVRSQGHADRLMAMGTARHKEPSLEIERSVEELGGLMLLMIEAKDEKSQLAWVKAGVQSVEIEDEQQNIAYEPPAPGMQQVWFKAKHLFDTEVRVTTDGHSQSPAFSQESRLLALALSKAGAMGPERLVEALHPPNADALIEDLARKEAEQEQLIKEHPELLESMVTGRHRSTRH